VPAARNPGLGGGFEAENAVFGWRAVGCVEWDLPANRGFLGALWRGFWRFAERRFGVAGRPSDRGGGAGEARFERERVWPFAPRSPEATSSADAARADRVLPGPPTPDDRAAPATSPAGLERRRRPTPVGRALGAARRVRGPLAPRRPGHRCRLPSDTPRGRSSAAPPPIRQVARGWVASAPGRRAVAGGSARGSSRARCVTVPGPGLRGYSGPAPGCCLRLRLLGLGRRERRGVVAPLRRGVVAGGSGIAGQSSMATRRGALGPDASLDRAGPAAYAGSARSSRQESFEVELTGISGTTDLPRLASGSDPARDHCLRCDAAGDTRRESQVSLPPVSQPSIDGRPRPVRARPARDAT
jgi:hypothetical protein